VLVVCFLVIADRDGTIIKGKVWQFVSDGAARQSDLLSLLGKECVRGLEK